MLAKHMNKIFISQAYSYGTFFTKFSKNCGLVIFFKNK